MASNVNLGGAGLGLAVRASDELTKWLLQTGAMHRPGSWEGVNTFTMTMNGMGKSNSWWDAMNGVRAQAQGDGVNRSDRHLSWHEFRAYAAILSVTGEKQWGRCTREDIAARAAGWVGVQASTKAVPEEIERRRAAGLMLSDYEVRSAVDYLEKSGRLAKVRFGHRTVFFGIGIDRDELRQKIAAMMKDLALAKNRAKTNRQSDLEWTRQVRASIAEDRSASR